MTLNAAAMGWIALIAGPDLAYWQMVAPLIISGAGVAMVLPATQNAVLSSVGPQQIGKASGSYSTPRQLGGAFRGRDIVAVFAGFGSYGSAETFSDGFAAALAACAALSLAGAGVAMLVPGVRSQRVEHGAALVASGQSEATKPPVDVEPSHAPS